MRAGYLEQNKGPDGSSGSETITGGLAIPTILAGFLGFGLVDVAYAESNEVSPILRSFPICSRPPSPHIKNCHLEEAFLPSLFGGS